MFEYLGENSSWDVRALGDFLSIKGDSWIDIDDEKDYRILGVTAKGGGLVIKRIVNGAELKMRQYQVARPNQLMWCKVDTTNGAFGITKLTHSEALSSPNMCLADIDTEICLPDFLQLFFKMPSVYDALTSASLGTTNRQYLKPQELLKQVRFHLPPLAEQKRIMARVESIVARVNEARQLRRDAEIEADVLIGREIASLFVNNKGWASYNLGDLISEMSYGTSEKAHNERVGIPVLRMGNIQNGKLDLTDLKFMHPSEQEMKKLRLQKGDILVNRTNSAELVGKCAVFDLEGEYLFASYIIRIRLDQQKADPRLVAQYINSPAGRAYMFAERKQMTGQANVNSKKLAALPIKLPPLDEQRRIVAYLDGLQVKVNALRELQSASGQELSALMPSILDKAFKGEL